MALDRDVLARARDLSFTYPGSPRRAVEGISLEIREGEKVAMLGPSGAGKSTVLRALSGLVPHFHGGCFSGRVEVAGLDTRISRPAELAGHVATVFQDPEDQIVMTRVANEVAFGLENLGVHEPEIWPRVERALAEVGIGRLADRKTVEISGGELQRVCLAAALAVRPRLLILDEPTSQLDPESASIFLELVDSLGMAVVISEHRIDRVLEFADRVVFIDHGKVVLDATVDVASSWLSVHRPTYLPSKPMAGEEVPALEDRAAGDVEPAELADKEVCRIAAARFGYSEDEPVLEGASLAVRAGEVVVLEGANGSGKTTLAKIAAGLLTPQEGSVCRRGRAGYLSQDPGRYLVKERVLDEAAVGARGDRARGKVVLARVDLAHLADRHPRDLSSGERERLGLAAVAVSEPELLVLDEPTRGIDPDRKQALAQWLFSYAAHGRGVLIATHDREFPSDRRLRLSGGRVQASSGFRTSDSLELRDGVFTC